jgi:hypothetical protein
LQKVAGRSPRPFANWRNVSRGCGRNLSGSAENVSRLVQFSRQALRRFVSSLVVFFGGNPFMEAVTVLDVDTIGNDRHGALLHDPFGVAA